MCVHGGEEVHIHSSKQSNKHSHSSSNFTTSSLQGSINTIIMAGADSLVLRFSLTKRKRS